MKLKMLFISAFTMLVSAEHDFYYTNQLDQITLIPKEVYQEAVRNLPICCVDIFLIDEATESYFLVLRKNAPAKGVWWLPGGRLFKNESFFDCAKRKCEEEIGLAVMPLAIVGTYATFFPDSAWGSGTHTINVAILAKLVGKKSALLDLDHEDFVWKPLIEPPDDLYVREVYDRALELYSKRV